MGVARRIGIDMSYWIILISGQPIEETNVQHVTHDNMLNPNIAKQITAFDQALTEQLENTNFIIDDFYDFVVENKGSNLPQWDTCNPSYRD